MYPNLPGTPAGIHFPPLFPLVLAPLFGIWSPAVAGAIGKALGIICFALACRLIVRHAVSRRLLGDDVPLWVIETLVAAVAFAIPVLSILGVLFSEPLFTLTLAGTLVLADRPAAEWSLRRAWSVGLLAAAALLLRSVGVAALAGLVVVAWRIRLPRRQVAALVLPGLIAGLSWGLWVAAHRGGVDPAITPDYGSYFEIFRDAGVRTFIGSLTDLPRPLSVLTLNWVPATWVYYALGVPALFVGGWGLCVLTRRSLLGWVLIAYLGVLALWPYPPDRFLWAILPWLALAWAAGAVALGRRKSKVLQGTMTFLTIVLAYGYVRYEVRGLSGHWWDLTAGRISNNMAELLPVIDSLPTSAVVATDNEPLVWLYTRRQAVPFYLFAYSGRQLLQPTPELQRSYLQRLGVTHVLLSGMNTGSAEQLDRLLGAYPGLLTITRRWSGGRALFELKRDHP